MAKLRARRGQDSHSARLRHRMPLAAMTAAVLCVIVVGAMVATALIAEQNADRHRRAQVLAEQVIADSRTADGIRWHAETDFYSGVVAPAKTLPLAKLALRDLKQLQADIAQLNAVAPDSPAMGRLQTDAQQLGRYGWSAWTLLLSAKGTKATAAELAGREFQPVVSRIEADAQRTGVYQQQVADNSQRLSTWALLASLVIGLSALSAIVWRFTRIERQTMLEDQRRGLERRADERMRTLFENSSDIVAVLDRELNVRWLSASVREALGHDPDALLGSSVVANFHPEDQALLASVLSATVDQGSIGSSRVRAQHADGSWRVFDAIANNRLDDHTIEGIVFSLHDVTEAEGLEQALRHQAFHDALTGLANRPLFEDRLSHALNRALTSGGSVAVLFIDLDDFKTVNDSLGHSTGDALLQAIAGRIEPTIRVADTIARLGGDEFAVLLDAADHEDARLIAERILGALSQPLQIDERALSVAASIGFAVSKPGIDSEELLRNADAAMYAAKASGKNAIREYHPDMHQTAMLRLELSADLPQALADGEFFLQYQPIVSIRDGRLEGVEALLRWQHPTRGLLGPGQFIALAEETGQIVPVGTWVLRQACMQASAWCQLSSRQSPLYVSVNASVRQLREESFPEIVAAALHDSQLDPGSLLLEITETVLASDTELLRRRLRALKELGVRIAVDDFGTGYSALSQIQQFPVDVLKIDKSFIDELTGPAPNLNIIETILQLAGYMNLEVIAEGIEHEDQRDRLLELPPVLGQGYLFSRPVDAEQITEVLDAELADATVGC